MKNVLFVAALMLLGVTSCNKSEEELKVQCMEEEFENDLKVYENTQKALLSKLSNLTRSVGCIDTDTILDIQMQLATNMDTYITIHQEYLEQFVPDEEIQDEDLDLMAIDPDVFLNYIKRNFSDDYYEILENYCSPICSDVEVVDNLDFDICDIENFDNYNLTPLEKLSLLNVRTLQIVDNALLDNVNNRQAQTKEEKEKVAACNDQFAQDMKDCAIVSGVIGIGGTAVGFFSGGFGAAVAWKVAAEYFATCSVKAAYDHDKCIDSFRYL